MTEDDLARALVAYNGGKRAYWTFPFTLDQARDLARELAALAAAPHTASGTSARITRAEGPGRHPREVPSPLEPAGEPEPETLPSRRMPPYPHESRPEHESNAEGRRRRERVRRARIEWERVAGAKCSVCGYARMNVVHETDPATAPEGPMYYADMTDLHEFVPATPPTDT